MEVDRILRRHSLAEPDGRPLHGYDLDDADRAELRAFLSGALSRDARGGRVPAAFVLWAADRIRTGYRGGVFKWQFVFDGLNRRPDQALATELVTTGLRWWHRKVRRSTGGRSFFLYSLLAEGGIPDHLLVDQESRYRRTVTGLMAEIEKLRALDDEDVWAGLAVRWTDGLPQAFQNREFVRLLASLAGQIARLRARIPPDVPIEAAGAWLDASDPGWMSELPLRPSGDAAKALVRGVVQAERGGDTAPAGAIAARELFRSAAGTWSGSLRIEESGQLSTALLETASGLRLRMMPTAEASIAPYSATPTDIGWDLRRLGGRPGAAHRQFEPGRPFGFAAYADGIPQGEVQVLPAIRLEEEGYALWRKIEDKDDQDDTLRLALVPGAARVRQSALWILTPTGARVSAGEGLRLSAPEACAGGTIRRIEGSGLLQVGTERIAVRTGVEEEPPAARIAAIGDVLPGWRTIDGELVWLGDPRFVGMREGAPSRTLGSRSAVVRPGRSGRFGERLCAWSDGGELVARLRFVSIPPQVRIRLAEPEEGCVSLEIDGLPPGIGVRLLAGGQAVGTRDARPAVALVLSLPGAPPGEVEMQLLEGGGGALRLVAPWPARAGMILSPTGSRVSGGMPLAIDGLRGWRLYAPERSDLQFNLSEIGHRVSLRVGGEVPLVAYIPLLQAILAQGNPDAQVNLKLLVGGRETTRRLEIRRYADDAKTAGGRAWFGLERDMPWSEFDRAVESGIAGAQGKLALHAIDLGDPSTTVDVDVDLEGCFDLSGILGAGTGAAASTAVPCPETTDTPRTAPDEAAIAATAVPGAWADDTGETRLWLVQARLDGRTQRAFPWSAKPGPKSTREGRIARYVERFHEMMADADDSDWGRFATLFRYVGSHGDAGILDQVQAMAEVPEAAVAFLLSRTPAELPEALALDLASPLFWPIVPVEAVVAALIFERGRQRARFGRVFEPDDAQANADEAVARSIGAVLRIRPELTGHMAVASGRARLRPFMLHDEKPVPLRCVAPERLLAEAANAAARRQDRLPNGLGGLRPRSLRLPHLEFAPFVQPIVEAPLVAAEVALGLRQPLSAADQLRLVNLRFVDPIYFDAALPPAIEYGASR